jgi:hypothetical protein
MKPSFVHRHLYYTTRVVVEQVRKKRPTKSTKLLPATENPPLWAFDEAGVKKGQHNCGLKKQF